MHVAGHVHTPGTDRMRGVALQAVPIQRLSNVEPHLMLGIKLRGIVVDRRRYGIDMVVRASSHIDIPPIGHAQSHAAHLPYPGGRRCGPTEVFAADLLRPLGHVLPMRLVVAGEAVHFEPAGNLPARIGIGQLVRRVADAAGQVASKLVGEFPRGKVHARSGNLRAGRFIDHDPRFGCTAFACAAKVRAAMNGFIVVACAARHFCRKRHGVRNGRNNVLSVFG